MLLKTLSRARVEDSIKPLGFARWLHGAMLLTMLLRRDFEGGFFWWVVIKFGN